MPPSTTTARPAPAPVSGRRRGRLAVLAVGGAAATAGLVLAAAAAVAADEALPGTRLAGVEVGGLGAADLRGVVDGPVRTALTTALPLEAAGTEFPVVPGRVGLGLQDDAAVAAALDAGRDGPLGEVRAGLARLGLLPGGQEVQVVASVDRALVAERVEQVRRQVDRGAAPGGFRVGPDLQVAAVPPVEGRALQVGATVDDVVAALVSGERDPLPAQVDVAAPPVPADAAPRVAEQARAALAAPVVLTGPDGLRLELAPTALGPLLGSRVQDGGLALTVDEAGVAQALAGPAAGLEQTARDARPVLPRPEVVLTAQGDTSFRARPVQGTVEPAAPGRDVDLEQAAARAAAAVLAGERTAELPVSTTAPRVTTGDLERVDQLLGSFTTRFSCCANRVTNIQLMARLLDGTVVMPGDVLDVNALVGPRTRAKGFLADGAIIDGELEDVVGGGVSQFATTLYNAAWFAGLDVLEHRPHSRYIGRYPAGREATLSFGSIELVVRNDTDAPVVLRTATTGTSVTAALYGSVGDRTVRSTTGPRSPRPDGGFRVSVSRDVLQGGRVVREDSTSWTYRAPLD